jgi:hypothetical protein
MKLSDAREAYESLSGKVSDIVRQLSLAGIGLVWVFKPEASNSQALNPLLFKAALFIFLALLLDFLQYLVGTIIWFAFFRRKEKQGKKEKDEFLAPAKLTWPTWIFFYLKSAMMLMAYGCYIIPFLWSRFQT